MELAQHQYLAAENHPGDLNLLKLWPNQVSGPRRVVLYGYRKYLSQQLGQPFIPPFNPVEYQRAVREDHREAARHQLDRLIRQLGVGEHAYATIWLETNDTISPEVYRLAATYEDFANDEQRRCMLQVRTSEHYFLWNGGLSLPHYQALRQLAKDIPLIQTILQTSRIRHYLLKRLPGEASQTIIKWFDTAFVLDREKLWRELEPVLVLVRDTPWETLNKYLLTKVPRWPK